MYVDGNTVRVLDDYDEILARAERSRKRRIKRTRAQRKRARALSRSMGIGYMLMLTAVCAITLFLCVHYLQLRSQSINQNETIAAMESSLSRRKADNDALENQLQTSLNLEEIKNTALSRLGLHYATESQIRYYNADNESYVRQYRTVSGD